MSRAKKILLIVLFLILLSQIPFAYRRYRLGRLNALIQMINSESRQLAQSRTRQSNDLSPYAEYKGVVHVHSFLGGHSAGTFQEILDGAIANQLDFVVMTEHVESQYDTSAMTLKGPRAGVLFINGNEVASKQGDRLLSIPGDVSLTSSSGVSTADVVANSRARNALSIIAYPEEFKSWSENVDGIEVYNVYTNARRINPLVALFDTVWSRRAFPALLFANYLQKPGLGLKKWDEILAGRRAVALAGNDSHSNVGLSLDDASGKQLVGLKLDPYRGVLPFNRRIKGAPIPGETTIINKSGINLPGVRHEHSEPGAGWIRHFQTSAAPFQYFQDQSETTIGRTDSRSPARTGPMFFRLPGARSRLRCPQLGLQPASETFDENSRQGSLSDQDGLPVKQTFWN